MQQVHAQGGHRRQTTLTDAATKDVSTVPAVPADGFPDASHRAGLTEAGARRRFRQRTVAECCVYALCWAILIVVSLPADRQAMQWSDFPRHTATVIQDPIEPGALLLQWIDPGGGLHDYAPDAGDHYVLGQQVQIVDAGTAGCGWDTSAGADDGIVGMVVFMGVLPLAGLGILGAHRFRLWRRLRHTARVGAAQKYSVSLYQAPWRTFVAISSLGTTYYVPLMRGQRIESLPSPDLLRPLLTPKPRAHVPFGIAGTNRVVWPGGGCHQAVWPFGRMVFTVLRVFGPMLLIPLAHWANSSLPPC